MFVLRVAAAAACAAGAATADSVYKINPLIVGGNAVTQEVPWMVAMKQGNELRCGGSLVAPQWVLTAGHCVGNFDSVVIGGLDWKTPSEGAETYQVEKVIAFPNYSAPTSGDDLALAKISGVTNKTPVQLNSVPDDDLEADGKQLTAMGWGVTSWGEKIATDTLMQTTLQVVNTSYCLDKYHEGVSEDLNITDYQLCAMWPAGGRDTCSGDSGGPLVDYNVLQSVQVAVVSYGVQCALQGWPAVYTRVSKYIDWIEKTIAAEPVPVYNGSRVDGAWSEWDAWSPCFVACGSGIRTRSRQCTNPAPANGGASCGGDSSQNEICSGPPCVADGGWTTWSPWSNCTATVCNVTGTQQATRSCTEPAPSGGGKPCDGETTRVQNCTGFCDTGDPNAGWGDWSPWTPCSVSCGPGSKMRMRVCNTDAHNCVGNFTDTASCSLGDCTTDAASPVPTVASATTTFSISPKSTTIPGAAEATGTLSSVPVVPAQASPPEDRIRPQPVRPCDEWGCTCQGFSDYYTTVFQPGNVYWGDAPPTARVWFIRNRCTTLPSDRIL